MPPYADPWTPGGTGRSLSDVDALVALLGGNASVRSFRDVRSGVQTTAGNHVAQWNDIRGAAGFGPALVVAAPSSHLVLSGGVVVGDGTAAAFGVVDSALYDIFNGSLTLYYVGTASPGTGLGATGPSALGSAFFGGGRAALTFINNLGFVAAEFAPADTATQPAGIRGYRTLDGRVRSMVMWYDLGALIGSATSVPAVIGTAATGTVTTDNPTNGEALGALVSGGAPAAFRCLAQLVVAGTPTNAQLNGFSQWAVAIHGAFDNSPRFVTWDGDSIANGAELNTSVGYTFNYATVALADSRLANYSDVNIGVPLLTVADLIARYATDNRYSLTSGAGVYADPSRLKDVVATNAGTNDLFFGASAATTFARMQQYAAMVHAQGRKVIQGTILPRDDNGGVDETARAALNLLILGNIGAGSTQFDAVADVASDPIMGLLATCNNPTYYFSDLVHPTATGHALLAPYWANAIASL